MREKKFVFVYVVGIGSEISYYRESRLNALIWGIIGAFEVDNCKATINVTCF